MKKLTLRFGVDYRPFYFFANVDAGEKEGVLDGREIDRREKGDKRNTVRERKCDMEEKENNRRRQGEEEQLKREGERETVKERDTERKS